MNILKYIYVEDFVTDIIKAELRQIIKCEQDLLRRGDGSVGDKAVLDAAKVLLRYYS